MRWRRKAAIQKVCDRIPRGDIVYRKIQRRFGNLSSDPYKRLGCHRVIARAMSDLGVSLIGSRCLEIGTGHVPVLPVALFLSGVEETVTVDLHRRLDMGLTGEMLSQLLVSEDDLRDSYAGLVDPPILDNRLARLRRYVDRPHDFLNDARIHYRAPADASNLLPNDAQTFDLHTSVTVLEHIRPEVLLQILSEGRRVLKPDGVAIHLIDPSDHFAHDDDTINAIHFLRYSEAKWERLAGNQFSYCNRLRASEFESLFLQAGYDLIQADRLMDERSLRDLRNGFPIHPSFRHFAPEDLCTSNLTVSARPKPA